MHCTVVIFCSLVSVGSLAVISGNVIPAVHIEPTSDQWITRVNQRNTRPSSTFQPPPPESVHTHFTYQPSGRENANKLDSVHHGEPQRFVNEKNEKKTVQHNNLQFNLHPLRPVQNEQTPPDTTIVPEPMPRIGNTLQEKLGFGMLSSLLPTSIFSQSKPGYAENLDETHSDDSANGLLSNLQFLRNPSLFQQHDESNTPFSGTSSDSSSDSENSEDANSPGLFSRIRNVLPFSKGLLSGLFNNDNNSIDGESGDTGGSMSLLSSDSYMTGETSDNNANPFSLFPSQQQSVVNGEGNSNSGENSESGSSFLSSIPNQFKTLTNLLPTINFEGEQEQSEGGGYDNNASMDPEDSALTPFQSISNGGLSGVLGAVVPYLSHFVKAFGVAKAKLPLIKIIGAVLGPILSAAIAAMVIGLVYVSFYITVTAIQNEGIEGEMYLLSIKQLIDILGIPDPLEELFDIKIMRSLQKRSIHSSRSLKQEKSVKSTTATDQCIERFACYAIGKKLMRSSSMKGGWTERGINWAAGNMNEENGNGPQNNSYSKIVRYGRSLIKAVSIGMEPVSLHPADIKGTISDITDNSICARYTCDPISSLRNLIKNQIKIS